MAANTLVRLTDAELLLLDGKASAEVQAEIDTAKAREGLIQGHPDLPPHIARLVADVLTEAKTRGLLIFNRVEISRCKYCERSPDPPYAIYKSGGKRGRFNYDKPYYLSGREFAQRFVWAKHTPAVGACSQCVEAALACLISSLAGVLAEVPKVLAASGRPPLKRYRNKKCKCGWQGDESKMLWEHSAIGELFGEGWAPAYCLMCGEGERGGLLDAEGYVVTANQPVKLLPGQAKPVLLAAKGSKK